MCTCGVVLWLFSSPVSFSSSFRCSSSGPSRCLPPSSTRGSSPKTCATSAWGPWPLQTTRHPHRNHLCKNFACSPRELLNRRLSSIGSVLSIVCSLFPLMSHPPTGRGHGRYPNIRTLGAADSASLQVYIEVLKNIMHTVNAMKMVECRCLVILALTCLPIVRNSRFVSTLSSWR